jgi:NAD(P)-dependent dehydrogenase (short-subunit alcohol dehydrogenase family)
MSGPRKTAIVTGASQGIGAGIVKGFVERGFNVVANSRKVTQSTEVAASHHVALVDGHIGEPATAAEIVETALSRFESIDALVNNAGIFFTKPFHAVHGRGLQVARLDERRGFPLRHPTLQSRRLLRATRSGASRQRCR